MPLNKRILYIGGGREALETLQKAKYLGLEVLYIQTKNKFRASLLSYVSQVVLIDYHDPNVLIPMAKTLQTLFPFDCCISLSEDALIAAALVRDALGLPGNSLKTVRLLKEKPLMREHLNAAGISPVAARVGSSLEDLKSFVQENGLPIIVKPTDAAGSIGIFRVDEVSQLEQILQKVQDLQLPHFLMEDYLDGPEISLESFTFHGHHVVMAVTEKMTLSTFVEVGHTIPARLDPELRDEVIQLVKSVLDLFNFNEGPGHTEVKLTSKGPRIVELHDRVPGDRINEMVRVAYGYDMKTMSFAWSCGLMEALEESPPTLGGSAIRFFVPQPGIVQEITGLEEVTQAEGVVETHLDISVGDRVSLITESYDRVGWVITSGANAQEASDSADKLAKQVRIITA